MTGLLFQLIQVAIGNRKELTSQLTAEEWAQLRLEFKKQALLGIGYCGIVRLPQHQTPPIQVLAQWVHNAEKIRKKNERLTEECARVCETLRHDGIECCVLKGQSNLVNYRPSGWDPCQNQDKNPSKNEEGDSLGGRRDAPQNPSENLTKNPEQNLASYRTPGDIDLWCKAPAEGIQIASGTGECAEYETYRGIAAIVEYAQMQCRLNGVPEVSWFDTLYYHIGIPWAGTGEKGKPTEVELHYRPSFLLNPIRNGRLQRWFEENEQFGMVRWGGSNKNQKNPFDSAYGETIVSNANCAPEIESELSSSVTQSSFAESKAKNSRFAKNRLDGTFPIPTNSFNAVYQLVHIFRHLFEEGIGLRQLLDYYFVLRALHIEQGEHSDRTQSMAMWEAGLGRSVMSNVQIMHQLKRFGLAKFASAVMYVLKVAFNMPDVYLLCKPNEKEGRWLLTEIMQSGNFGRSDERNEGKGHIRTKLSRALMLVKHYPHEALWQPWFMTYHWLWRRFEWWR